MAEGDAAWVAEAAGVEPAYIARLAELGILGPLELSGYGPGDARRAALVRTLELAGLPLEGIAAAVRQGTLSLAFVDLPSYQGFASFQAVTFAQTSAATGVPIELLLVIREAMGFARPEPDDRMRAEELDVVPFARLLLDHGVRPSVAERLLRVSGDSGRRIAETGADLWRTEILEPLFAAGRSVSEIGELTGRLAAAYDELDNRALLAIMHGQQTSAWTKNIFEGFERELVAAGLHAAPGIPPAICFLDVTGFTRLTEERGDAIAADLAGRLARIAQQTSVGHGGKPIKWLGDGVMFHFREPGGGVLAALDMVEQLRDADMPPTHVGLDAGPVLFQEGDYFGRTVNTAARIAEYARQGEVLVSQAVVDVVDNPEVSFREIGPVELKGLAEALRLHAAGRTHET
jgi:adenylate cyclase